MWQLSVLRSNSLAVELFAHVKGNHFIVYAVDDEHRPVEVFYDPDAAVLLADEESAYKAGMISGYVVERGESLL